MLFESVGSVLSPLKEYHPDVGETLGLVVMTKIAAQNDAFAIMSSSLNSGVRGRMLAELSDLINNTLKDEGPIT